MIPQTLFSMGLWIAYALVALGAFYLLAALTREWRARNLW